MPIVHAQENILCPEGLDDDMAIFYAEYMFWFRE